MTPSFPWQDWLRPAFSGEVPSRLAASLDTYLELLLRWNARTNLTSVRDAEGIARRHIAESLFLAENLPAPGQMPLTMLDHGSGAGFPGLMIALYRPEIAVTLSESQHKKTAFLREAVRALALPNVVIHAGRTSNLTGAYTWVTARAVDRSGTTPGEGWTRVSAGGWIIMSQADSLGETSELPVPGSQSRYFIRAEPGAPHVGRICGDT